MYNVTNLRNKLNIAFGETIYNRRKRAGLSQTELGDMLQLTKSTISKYEKGEIEIPATVLPIVSRKCNFSMDEYKNAAEDVFIESNVYNTFSYMTSASLDESISMLFSADEEGKNEEEMTSDLLLEYMSFVNEKRSVPSKYKSDFMELISKALEQDQSNKYKRILNYIYEYQKNDIM